MLQNRLGIIFGVANKRSIAWATALSLHEAGARLAFTYQGDRLKENVEGLTGDAMPNSLVLPCDVTKQDESTKLSSVSEQSSVASTFLSTVLRSPRARPSRAIF